MTDGAAQKRVSVQEAVAIALPDAVQRLLREMSKTVKSRLRSEESEVVERALSADVKRALAAASIDAASPEELEALSDANAAIVALTSSWLGNRFPKEVAVDSLIPLSNLLGSIGREHERRQEPEMALEYFVRALQALLTLRILRPWFMVNKIAYWLMLRVATVVGSSAVERGLTLDETLGLFDSNMDAFVGLLGTDDPRASRAFTAISFARAAVTKPSSDEDLRRLRNELLARESDLTPRNPGARAHFERELRLLLSQLELHSSKQEPAFNWTLKPDPHGKSQTRDDDAVGIRAGG